MAIGTFAEMRKIDVSKYIEKRDGYDYLNWAKCIDLLHENGAEKAYFEPLTNENGSSLFMSDRVFTDKNGNTNSCYEVAVKVVIDDLVFEMRSPLMNGSNPVKDNSMSQQRVWNSQTRAFVKGVAIYTGLGFDLWCKAEQEEKEEVEEDLSVHKIMKIKDRIFEVITEKLQAGFSMDDLAEVCQFPSRDEFELALKTYFASIHNIEVRLRKMPNDKQ